jgi:hypothetical protein
VGDNGYVLLARVRFASIEDSQVPVDELGRNIGPYDMQLALAGGQTVLMDVGAVEPELGASPGTELWAVVYDIDDNNRIDLGDLAFLAPNFGKTRDQVQSGAQTLVFPPNFPDAWRPVPAEPGGEGGAMGGEAVHLPSSAAAFTEFGIAEAERTPPWLRPRPAANGPESRSTRTSQQPEFPPPRHSPSDSSTVAPTQRAHRWS